MLVDTVGDSDGKPVLPFLPDALFSSCPSGLRHQGFHLSNVIEAGFYRIIRIVPIA